jgi:uncharacterized repeat protein (TIGR01451 family)
MMKKFFLLITVSLLAGMLGAYVTTASAQQSCSPGYAWDTVKNCCTDVTKTQCRELDGRTYCSTMDDGSSVYNANGDPIENCLEKNARCKSYTPGVAQCVPNGSCNPNAPLNVCANATTATNNCGRTETCSKGKVCEIWRWCVDPSPEQWFCSTPNPVTNKSYLRHSSKWREEVCPGWCNADGNGDKNGGDAICVPGTCDEILKNQRICNGWGNIINWCGETIDYCSDRNEACHATSTTTCECRPKPPVVDLCTNIPGGQTTVPSGMTKDTPGTTPGNCSSPDSCAGASITTSQDYINPNSELNVACKIGGQDAEIWVKARYWDSDNNKWYDIDTKVGKWNASFRPVDNSSAWWPKSVMKTNEINKVSCRLNQDKICAQKDVYVNRVVCDTRWFTATAIHATIGQEVEFDCHGGAGYGANIGMYQVNLPNQVWDSRFSLGVHELINQVEQGKNRDWNSTIAGIPFKNNGWVWTSTDGRNLNIRWEPYCLGTAEGKTPSCASKGTYGNNFTGGTMKWKPTQKGMFWAQCVPSNINGWGYSIGRDIDSCGSRYVIVDDKPGTDVQIVKSVDRSRFPNQTGTIITWTLTYKNNGPSAAENVVITDTLPAGLVYDDVLSNTPTGIFSSIKAIGNNQIQWTFNRSLAVNESGSIIFKTRYTGGKPDNVPLVNQVLIKTDTPGDLGSNNGWTAQTVPDSVLQKLVSCENNTVTPTLTTTGVKLDYVCAHAGGTNGRFEVYSGAVKLYTVNWFSGSVTVPYGTYTTQCVIDDTIKYKVVEYKLSATQSCPYKKNTTTTTTPTTCAVKSALDPILPNSLNLAMVIGRLNPIPYCSTDQLDDTAYLCQATAAGDTLYTRDDAACSKAINIVSAKLGDKLWHDADRDGVQDADEVGISWSKVSLYTCGGALLDTRITNANGTYLFDPLLSWSYKVVFDMPAWYTTFTSKLVGSTSTDSNTNAAGSTDCINLAWGEENLTIDAGVYKGGSCSSCGWSNSCGDWVRDADGVDNIAGNTDDEECDDGNQVNGDMCSRSCKIEWGGWGWGWGGWGWGWGGWGGWGWGWGGWTRPGGWSSNTTKKIVKKPKWWYIDPPDVMIGEYLPFWWSFDKADNTEFVDHCNQPYESNITYVLNQRDQYGAVCEFYLVDAIWTKSKPIQHYCDERRNLTWWKLFDSYLDGVVWSVGVNSIKDNYLWSSGASFISPLNWKTMAGGEFTNFGEYRLVWDKATYYTCNAIFEEKTVWKIDNKGNEIPGTRKIVPWDFVRYERSDLQISDVDIDMKLTVTKPYLTQKNGLSVSQQDALILDNIFKVGIGINNGPGRVIPSGVISTTTFNQYSGSANMTYLAKQFVAKYKWLAQTTIDNPGWLPAGIAKKVNSSEIYVLSSGSIISATSALRQATIIVPDWNIEVRGNLDANVMIIVPNGSIRFTMPISDTASQPSKQSVRGIHIAQSIVSDDLNNTDLTQAWRFWWQLKFDGLLVNLTGGITKLQNLKLSRRSSLPWFFGSNPNYSTIIKDGAALQIATDPKLWTNLPPGANELMKELQAFK